jgi:tetratricopeptide (TPR) repeat protein
MKMGRISINSKFFFMKFNFTKTRTSLVLSFFLLIGLAGYSQMEMPQGSQKASVTQRVGITDITITYSRPSVNGREIWGKLVPYGMNNLGFGTAEESPWRAGANENTTIHFTDDVSIQGKKLAAGTYGLHMILHEDGKVDLIFSNNSTAWGSYFYDPSEDALRVSVDSGSGPHTELLTYEFPAFDKESTTAVLRWAEKTIPFKIDVDVTEVVLAQVRKDLQGQKGFSDQNWNQAATWSMNNGGDMEEALAWSEAAISEPFIGIENYNNLQTKAQILDKMGKTEEAEKVMETAMTKGTVFQVHQYGRQLIAQGEKEKALEVFKKNAKMHKDTWPVNYGLARGYSAMGDYKKALQYLEKAYDLAPQQANKDRVQANIEKLKKGEDIN